MAKEQDLAERRRKRAEHAVAMGQRILWLREAYEQREPLRHSQQQWADWLGISGSVMNRIEYGVHAPLDVLVNIIYLTGATGDYLHWGVVDRKRMPDWLYVALVTQHGHELFEGAEWDKRRLAILRGTTIGGQERKTIRAGRVRGRQRKAKQSPSN